VWNGTNFMHYYGGNPDELRCNLLNQPFVPVQIFIPQDGGGKKHSPILVSDLEKRSS
jgi:hypothetical protein